MAATNESAPLVAIACGGTGGHLFPGLAVGYQLLQRRCAVTLFISPKEVDQLALKTVAGMGVVTLPAVALTRGSRLAFLRGCSRSYRTARKHFQSRPPQAALAMGGFTSLPAILAAKKFGARTFLHESNSIPGRANRWLSRVADRAFVGFESAAARLHCRNIKVTGTPVRAQFQARDSARCRAALGLDEARPVVLVMGGSQGAGGLNQLVIDSLPWLAKLAPQIQWFHLSGAADAERLSQAYARLNLKAVVHSFFPDMDLALGAATAAISRAGASSLAELAAMRVPAILVPYPAATDNHQFYNARAFEETGSAYLLEQNQARPEKLGQLLLELVVSPATRERVQNNLADWDAPRAAEEIAAAIVSELSADAMADGHAIFPVPGDWDREPRPVPGR